ncbi:MAG: hypothetical protein QOI11_4004 [Candidatus Eremiobacteraeota bacterium]|jgi:hypothetical protein|nr:hypothetical protein [Candidatus Eremiobacteraeota bacterium]
MPTEFRFDDLDLREEPAGSESTSDIAVRETLGLLGVRNRSQLAGVAAAKGLLRA